MWPGSQKNKAETTISGQCRMPHADEVDAATQETATQALDGMMDAMRPTSAIETEEPSEQSEDGEKPRKNKGKGQKGKRVKKASVSHALFFLFSFFLDVV